MCYKISLFPPGILHPAFGRVFARDFQSSTGHKKAFQIGWQNRVDDLNKIALHVLHCAAQMFQKLLGMANY